MASGIEFAGGRALDGFGRRKPYYPQPNSECLLNAARESVCARYCALSRGKEPRPPAKVPEWQLSVAKDVDVLRQLGGWLRGSHSFKECVTAHQSSVAAPKMVGT